MVADAEACNHARTADYLDLPYDSAGYALSLSSTLGLAVPPPLRSKQVMHVPMQGNCLRARVESASGVPKMDLWGTCDPYVVLVAVRSSTPVVCFLLSFPPCSLGMSWNDIRP
jgi:hypothetical protein